MSSDLAKKVRSHRVLSAALALFALTGWGLYASAGGPAQAEYQNLEQRLRDVEAERLTIAGERDGLRARADALSTVQAQLLTVQDELQALQNQRTKLDPQKERLRTAEPAASPSGNETEGTGTASPSIQSVQQALVRAGFGPLKVDGELGSQTQRAIRAFEAAKRLPVTGEINPGVLRALEPKVKQAIR